jgi:hypothetical protein
MISCKNVAKLLISDDSGSELVEAHGGTPSSRDVQILPPWPARSSSCVPALDAQANKKRRTPASKTV